MNRYLTACGPCCLALACLLGGGMPAAGQVVLEGQLRAAPGLAWGVPDNALADDAVGDPWWDDASRPQAAVQAGDQADDQAGDQADDQADDAEVDPQAELRAQADAMRHGLEQQGLAILRRELSIVRQTCPSLERQQRALVLRAGREAIARLADEQLTAALGRRRGKRIDMDAAIGTALRKAVAANAAAAESAAYEAEGGLRQERAKQATIAMLVADVDRDAFLDDAERESLARTLAESYRERWRQAAAALEHGAGESAGPPPQGVERCVEKALGKDRQAEWLARREEARKLLAQAGNAETQIIGPGGMLQIQPQVIGGGGGAVRRVIRHRVVADGNAAEVQLEVQIGGGAQKDEEAAAAEEEKE